MIMACAIGTSSLGGKFQQLKIHVSSSKRVTSSFGDDSFASASDALRDPDVEFDWKTAMCEQIEAT